jgi:lipopolysaccharide/colanic/teichoic acid biosynthesis glycosyltransferase
VSTWLRVRARVDCLVAAGLLLIVSPLIAFLGWRVRSDGGPALVGLPRIGRHGERFVMWKLRSMRCDVEDGRARGALLSGWSDRRVTPFGRWLRQWRLDELPQLWNVVRGDMALVGPRPETPELVDRTDDRWAAVLAARPAIAGPAQVVVHRFEAAIVDGPDGEERYVREILPAKLAVDRWYLRAASPLLDLFVIGAIAHRFLFRRPGGRLERRVAAAVPEFSTLREKMETERGSQYTGSGVRHR